VVSYPFGLSSSSALLFSIIIFLSTTWLTDQLFR
jgi:hypothetical protein